MVIGVLRVEFTLHGNASLKGKRSVAQSLKRKMRNKFNVSVAEVESQESHTRLVLAASTVANEWKHVESRLTKCLNMLEAAAPEEITDSSIELFCPE
ncbi:MAG: DUF503 domain-containing protein [Oceanidesulfovibrio sp.]